MSKNDTNERTNLDAAFRRLKVELQLGETLDDELLGARVLLHDDAALALAKLDRERLRLGARRIVAAARVVVGARRNAQRRAVRQRRRRRRRRIARRRRRRRRAVRVRLLVLLVSARARRVVTGSR